MKPIKFPEQNTIVAKDQKPYFPLPAYIDSGPEGAVIACWGMTFRERLQVLFTGKVWLSLWCFHKPVTPSKVAVFKSEILTIPK